MENLHDRSEVSYYPFIISIKKVNFAIGIDDLFPDLTPFGDDCEMSLAHRCKIYLWDSILSTGLFERTERVPPPVDDAVKRLGSALSDWVLYDSDPNRPYDMEVDTGKDISAT